MGLDRDKGRGRDCGVNQGGRENSRNLYDCNWDGVPGRGDGSFVTG